MFNDNQLEKDIEELKKQAEEYLNGWKRAKADFANYQKQVEKEKAEWLLFSSAGCVKAFLPVLDSLEMATRQHTEDFPSPVLRTSSPLGRGEGEGIAEGLWKIRDQMLDILRQMGVEQIKTIGETVNPELHEVVDVEKINGSSASGGKEAELPNIIKEVQAGYIMHGKVLRAAKVIVAE